MIRQSLAFLAAASLSVTPALAQSASALSIAPAIERAGPSAADSDLEGAATLPLIVFAAIIVAGVLLATGVIFDDDDAPSSP